MAVAAVVPAPDLRQLAQLGGRHHAIGHGDAQHVGVKLEIEAVHQPDRLELLLRQLAGQPALDLFAELLDALGDELPVDLVIVIDAGTGAGRDVVHVDQPSEPPERPTFIHSNSHSGGLLAQIQTDGRAGGADPLAHRRRDRTPSSSTTSKA